MDRLTIGAVANLTGVPSHTLRKWESRHSIVVPDRSDSGRRFYNNSHVHRLLLVKRLMSEGHALGELARLGTDGLENLSLRHDRSRSETLEDGVDVVGLNLAPLFERAKPEICQSFSLFPQTLESWLDRGNKPSRHHKALMVESDTLPDTTVESLIKLRNGSYQRVIIVYAFAPRRIEQLLASHGIQALKSPITPEHLRTMMSTKSLDVASEPVQIGVSAFNPEQLSSIANMMPSLHCECPNHIAKLLIDISGFEKYCLQCKDDDPKEKALHAQLAEMSARARTIFESALRSVAVADGLDLDNLP
ncbi:MerR family transcriptional regulator [Pseudomonadales bacterium]|nr:MerR family transcriptional regulator [Pseudomonadales bacterium]